jgi:hypothetical protein
MIISTTEESKMYDFEDVNRILAEINTDNMVEPIDDPSLEINFWDWADIVGVVDEYIPEEYTV